MTLGQARDESEQFGDRQGPAFLPAVRSAETRRIPRLDGEITAWLASTANIGAIEALIALEAPFLEAEEIVICRSAFEAGLGVAGPKIIEGSFGLVIGARGEFRHRNIVSGYKAYKGYALFWIDPNGVIRTGWIPPGSIGLEPSDESVAEVLAEIQESSIPVAAAPILERVLTGNEAERRKAIERFCTSAARIGTLRFAEALFGVLEPHVRAVMDRLSAGNGDVDLGEAVQAAAEAVGYDEPGASGEGARARKITEHLRCYVHLVSFAQERMRQEALSRAPAVEAALARRVDFDRATLAGKPSIEAYNWLGGATGAEGKPGQETWPDPAEMPSERAGLWRRQAAASLGHLLPLLLEVDPLSSKSERLSKLAVRIRSVVDEGSELITEIASEFGVSPATIRFVRDRVKLEKSDLIRKSEQKWLRDRAAALEACPRNWLRGLSAKQMSEALCVLGVLQELAGLHGYDVRDLVLETHGQLTFNDVRRGHEMTVFHDIDDSRRFCVRTLADVRVAAELHAEDAIEYEDVERLRRMKEIVRDKFDKELSTRSISGANTLAQLLRWSERVHDVMILRSRLPTGWGSDTAWPALVGRYGDETTMLAEEITSVADILAEAEAMRHCVATYVPRVAKGECVLFRLIDRGAHIGTVEIAIVDRAACIRQAAGFQNRVLPEPALAFCKRLEAATGLRIKAAGESYLKTLEDSTESSRETTRVRDRLEADLMVARSIWPSLAQLIAGPFKELNWRQAGEHLRYVTLEVG